MLTVGNDETVVERQLAGGQLECPGCGGQLRGWGHAREREIRLGGGPGGGCGRAGRYAAVADGRRCYFRPGCWPGARTGPE
jgi:hypothetical protein